jgi:RNA-directed DNA polymerase
MVALRDFLKAKVPFAADELDTLIATAQYRYKVYKLKKRSGKGWRTIAHPAPEVKLIQRLLVKTILSGLPVHTSATGYRPGKSTADHATPHLGSRFLLKMDFSDFFPSVTANDVRMHALRHLKLDTESIEVLVKILCWRNKSSHELTLSIGAPSSPLISNSILFDFDSRLAHICQHHQVAYTRYADDLAFSTNRPHLLIVIRDRVREVINEIAYPRLRLNEAKTLDVSKRHRRSLAGLVLTPQGYASLGRDRKRLIHSKVFRCLKGDLSVEELGGLRGLLAYAWSVEPTFVQALLRKYGNGVMELLELPFRTDLTA